MKVWQKKTEVNKQVEQFTIGKDREFDLLLAEYDVLGSMAHAKMLAHVGLIRKKEYKKIHIELKNILKKIRSSKFRIAHGIEDIHSQIELLLIRKLGDTGEKIHTARSRNDQVLLDIKLFSRNEIFQLVENVISLFNLLIMLSNRHKKNFLPGYTHLQIAMPSSFGLWFGAYAECLKDDLQLLFSVYKIINKNPLGSGAGYGSSLPINRTLTAKLLGFDGLNNNSVYAQMTRGKTEKTVSYALAGIACTLSKLATDVCLFMNQNFDFISFPEELTTGSSIMPHKKNPDVFELIRAKCNRIQTLPEQIAGVMRNLPSGYHRDLQILKEIYLPTFAELNSCLTMAILMLEQIKVKKNILSDRKYQYLFSVDAVNELVKDGIPFRRAYRKIGNEIASGKFVHTKKASYTHEGSIGNLRNNVIIKEMNAIKSNFKREKVKVEKALNQLQKTSG